MKSFLLLLAACFCVIAEAVSLAQQKVNQQVFEAVVREVSKFHYDNDFANKYAQIIQKYRKKTSDASNDGELGRLLNEFLRQLPDSHLGVVPPPDSNLSHNVPLQNDIILMESGGKVFVYNVTGEKGAGKILKKGDEIISINGFVPDRNARFGMVVQLQNKFIFGVPGRKSTVEFIRSGRKMRSSFINVKREKYPKLFKLGEMPSLPEFYESKMLNENTGYIRFDIFVPNSLMNLRQDVKNKFKNTPNLVIDLRNNMGGLIMLGVNSASFLSSKRVDFGTMTIGGQKLTPKSYPQKDRYRGRIFLLIGRNSYSTAEIFAQAMFESGDAVLVGEKTSGMCLPSVVIPLPCNFKLQTVVGDYVSSKNYRIEGKGVVPQKIVKLSAESLADGTDLQLEAVK